MQTQFQLGSYIHACTNETHSLANLQDLIPTLAAVNIYVTVLAKTRHVRTKTEFDFIAVVFRHTPYLYIHPQCIKC